jgi:membrane protease YdiL (CAAX protease family)
MEAADQKTPSSRFLIGILSAIPLFLVTTLPAFVSSLRFELDDISEKIDLPSFLLQFVTSTSGEVSLASFLTVYFALILIFVILLCIVAWPIILATKKLSGTAVQFSGFLQPPIKMTSLVLILVADVLNNTYYRPLGRSMEYLVGMTEVAPSFDSFIPEICQYVNTASISSFFALIISVIVAPCCEELYFRGYLYNLLSTRLTSFWVCAITSVLFSIGHFASQPFAAAYFIQLFAAGIFLFLARKVSNGILWPILCHFAVNLSANIVCI